MKKTTLKKLLTSLTITTLIIGLVAPSVVSGDENEEPIVDKVEEIKTDDVNEAEEVAEEIEVVEDSTEEPVAEEVKQDVKVQATTGVAPLYASVLIADTTTLEEAFPDVNFRTWVYETALGNGVGSYVDDTHKTATMSQSEIDNKIIGRTASISVASKGISSLEGIEHFKSVTGLAANGNNLSGVLNVTHMDNLTSLTVQANQLDVIDVTGLEKLKTLYAYSNGLMELRLSGNIALENLRAYSNNLTSINVNDAVALATLQVQSNEIDSIDLSQNSKLTTLTLNTNKLTGTLDVTHMEDLANLTVHTNKLEVINVEGLKKLKTLYVYTNDLSELKMSNNIALTGLRAYGNKLTSVNLTDAIELTELQMQSNELESIDLSNNDKLLTIVLNSNKLTGILDVRHIDDLTSLQAHNNKLETVNVEGLEKLKTLYVYTNKLSELKMSNNIALTGLRAYGNKLKALELTDAIELTELQIHANELEMIDLSNNSKIITLNLNTNKLTGTLDLIHMDNLASLQVHNNQIEKVDVSGLTELKTLYVYNNVISELRLSGNTGLTTLRAYINKIPTLNLSDSVSLTEVQLHRNELVSLDVSALINLEILHTHYNPSLTIDLSNNNLLSSLVVSKSINANLSNLTSFYVTGSKTYGEPMTRLTGEKGAFSWDSTTQYYVVEQGKGAQYAVGIPAEDDDGNFTGIVTSSYIDLSQGALMDEEGNLILGATLSNVNGDGSITLDSGTIVTGDGVYDFTGEFTIKDGEITTGNNYSYSKNIIDEDGTVVVGGETTTITVPNGSEITVDVNDSEKTVTYPVGSTVTKNDGDTIYVIDEIEMNSDGTISSGSYITVPNGTTVVDNGDGTVTIPKDMVVTLDDEDTVYPGEIIFDTSTGKTEYVPISGLITEDETNGTNLGAGVDEGSLSKAEEILNSITDGKLKDQLEEIVNTVKDMLDASKEVNDMYDADGNLKSTVTEEMIQEIEDIVNALPDGTFKDNLKDKVEEAQTTLDQRNEDAQDKVDDLFNEDKTDLNDGVGKKEIDEAQKAVDKLPDGDKKEELQKEIDKAKDLLDEKETNAQKKVDELFNEDRTDLGNGVGKSEIDEAQKAVDKLPNGDKKDELQKEIDKAQNMLDAKYAVNDLFNPDGSIKDGVTQDDIKDALDLVNDLPDGSLKEELLNLIKEAQKAVDERTYVVLEGFTTFTGKGNVSARIDAPVENFSKVYVNGKELDKSNHEVTSGSTIITLKESYLLTLENKTYDVEIEFVSGAKINVPLTVNVKGNASIAPPTNSKPVSSVSSTTGGSNVNTGDSTDLTLLYAMLIASLLRVFVVVRRKYEK